MKKVVLAGLLAVSSATYGFAQQPVALGAQQAGGQVQMSQEEYAAYNNANTQSTPAAKAQAFEAYLKAYPNSAVKADVLQQLMAAYSAAQDTPNTLSAADRLLQVDPNNLRALVFESYLRRQTGDANTDAAAKTAALDQAAAYATKGLSAPKPASMSDADFKALTGQAYPLFNGLVGDDDLSKKDYPGAIAAFNTEISLVPDQTQTPGPVLQDMVYLANAYLGAGDSLNCAWYATRAAAFAGSFASQIQPLASYCYKKYHGTTDGYDKLQALVKTSVTPPADLSTTVTPAPKPADIVANLVATTPDLATLAISDKEYVLQYGKQADADKVFDTIKGKSVEIPDAVVVAATADQLQVAVSEDAQQSKTADFTFNMKESLKTIPAVGAKIAVSGTYASYTQTPLMIVMSDGAVVEKKKPAAHTPAHRPAAHR